MKMNRSLIRILLASVMAVAAIAFGILFLNSGISTANAGEPDIVLDTTFNAQVADAIGSGYISIVQPDGKILVGGTFDFVSGIARSGVIRLNSDGSVDNTFDPGGAGANGEVLAIVLQNNQILIGGGFSSYDGVPVGKIARLNADGTLDPSFNAGGVGVSGSRLTSLDLAPNGKIVVTGQGVSTFNGVTNRGVFRLNADGSLDTSFTSGFSSIPSMEDAEVQSDGKIVIAGNFNSYAGQTVNGMARLNVDGTLDTSFNMGSGLGYFGGAGAGSGVQIQPDGKIVIAGEFDSYNGASRNGVARINPDGSVDTTFVPAGGGAFEFCAVQSDGKIVVTGQDGDFGKTIVRYNPDGSRDNSLGPVTFGYGYHVSLQTDGKILATGLFMRVAPDHTRFGIARFDAGGSLDPGFAPQLTRLPKIRAITVQSDGKLLVGGEFTTANGTPERLVARFLPNGTLDTTLSTGTDIMSPATTISFVDSIIEKQDGKILIGGVFRYWNSNRAIMARLTSTGSLDPTFNLTGGLEDIYSGRVQNRATLLQPDGKIVISTVLFNSVLGINRRIERLVADGALDTTFNIGGNGANSFVQETLRQPDGKLIIVGLFTTYNGVSRNRIARLNADGTLDTTFDPGTGANAPVSAAVLQPDGRIVIGGNFTSYNGVTANRLARINTDGTLDTTFDAGIGPNRAPAVIAAASDGKFWVGGSFDQFGGQPANYLVRVTATGSLDPALSSGLNGPVYTLESAADGSVLVGGNFTMYNAVPKSGIVRLIPAPAVPPPGAPFDFDGDGRTDVSVFRPSTGVWYLNRSTDGFTAAQFGLATDKITPADLDGDGKSDIAVFRDGTWYWLKSSDSSLSVVGFGIAGDVPVPADYTGDGRDELAVYRDGTWFTLNTVDGSVQIYNFGLATDKPVPADFDGDGKTDYAVYRDGTWYMQQTTAGFSAVQFGLSGDKTVVGDYDGDQKADQAVFRAGIWYVLGSQDGFSAQQFGIATDIPLVGDFDGDGRFDMSVYRDGTWYLNQTQAGIGYATFGVASDKPVPASFVP